MCPLDFGLRLRVGLATHMLANNVPATDAKLPDLPHILKLAAYPNPFSVSATIEFTVPMDGSVTLEVYTLQGQKVETLFSGFAEKDVIHKYKFDGDDKHNQSIYVYILKTQNTTEMGKLIMVK